MNLIKTKPKEFVRYNIRQNSRVYPAGGSRMNSSNYMPQVIMGSLKAQINYYSFSDLLECWLSDGGTEFPDIGHANASQLC